MDCRAFRKNHVAFVDDLLPGVEMVAMQCHRSGCDACARHDMLVRRSLLLVRNVPIIQPSTDFARRLNARLRECPQLDGMAQGVRGRGSRSVIAAAASVLVVGYLSVSALELLQPDAPMVMTPAVAYEPAPQTPPIASPSVVAAAVSTGIPLWSSMLLAEQAPAHFAAEFRLTTLTNWSR
ncbi:MAG TPA: hypothetical protein VMM18_07090 [Gemmatimonadaceae bacterium]|nr:hypothetical protein [Gemmatimonadaceae bacterium]